MPENTPPAPEKWQKWLNMVKQVSPKLALWLLPMWLSLAALDARMRGDAAVSQIFSNLSFLILIPVAFLTMPPLQFANSVVVVPGSDIPEKGRRSSSDPVTPPSRPSRPSPKTAAVFVDGPVTSSPLPEMETLLSAALRDATRIHDAWVSNPVDGNTANTLRDLGELRTTLQRKKCLWDSLPKDLQNNVNSWFDLERWRAAALTPAKKVTELNKAMLVLQQVKDALNAALSAQLGRKETEGHLLDLN